MSSAARSSGLSLAASDFSRLSDDAEILDAVGAQRIDRGAVGIEHMVHGAGGGAQVAIAGRVDAEQMAEDRDAPRLVDGGGGVQTVAEILGDKRGIVGEPAGDVAVHPAALVLQGAGQVPVVERRERLEAALEHAVDQAVVEVDARLVDGARAFRDQARPGEGKAVAVKAAVADQVEVLGPAVDSGRRPCGRRRHSSHCPGWRRRCPRCEGPRPSIWPPSIW